MGPHDVAVTYENLHRSVHVTDESIRDAQAMCEDMLDAFRLNLRSRVAVYAMAESLCPVLPVSDEAMAALPY